MDVVAISWALAAAATSVWMALFAQQLYRNYQSASTKGISMYLVLFWLTGDVLSFNSALAKGASNVILLLACGNIVLDGAFLFQILYYRWTTRTEVRELLLLSDARPARIRHILTARERAACVCLVAFATVATAALFLGRANKAVVETFAWIPTCMFVSSRFPQLYSNYVHKNASLMHITTFVMITCANGLFLSSLLVQCAAPGIDVHAFLSTNIQWIVGPCCTILLDGVIFAQYHVYRASSQG